MKTSVVGLLLATIPAFAEAPTIHSVLSPKKELALTPENLCLGFKNVFAVTKQSFQDEANLICPGQVPTPLLTNLISNAYQGVGQPVITEILVLEDEDNETSQITVGYATKVPKSPAQALLGEEKHVPVTYAVEPLTITPKFGAPVPNTGDSDTAFTVEQRTVVDDNVSFDDLSIHDLKLYRMHPNNFDFMLAVRTLRTPSEQFKKAVVVRAVMKDPANPNGSIIVSLMNFLMNSREEHDNVVEVFSDFIRADMIASYNGQIK